MTCVCVRATVYMCACPCAFQNNIIQFLIIVLVADFGNNHVVMYLHYNRTGHSQFSSWLYTLQQLIMTTMEIFLLHFMVTNVQVL